MDRDTNLLIDRKNNVKNNIASILLYALSLATALGFNNLVTSIFNSFKWNSRIIANTIYVVLTFFVTISLAYYLNTSLKENES